MSGKVREIPKEGFADTLSDNKSVRTSFIILMIDNHSCDNFIKCKKTCYFDIKVLKFMYLKHVLLYHVTHQ